MATALTPDQVKRVLRRAAELERKHEPVETPDAVEEIALEVGLAPSAVSRALAEAKSGVLEAPAERGFLDRVIGDHQVEVERVVDAPLADVERALEIFLTGQLFRIARRHGDRVVWRGDVSLISHARRTFDIAGRYELPRNATIDTFMVPEGAGTRVRLGLSLDRPQRQRARSLAGALALGGGIIAAGTVLAHTAMWDGIMVAIGSGTALAGWGRIRGRHRDDLAGGVEALERFLDLLPGSLATH